MTATPILVIGAGRMGGAIMDGWALTGTLPATEIGLIEPHPGPAVERAVARGSSTGPDLAAARTVLLAVKPQTWREAAAPLAEKLAPEAIIVSIMAGVRLADLSAAFAGRPVARVMPTTGVAVARGVATCHAASPEALARARALFAPIAEVVTVDREELMDAATAVSGSGPAYLYVFVEALAAAGVTAGLGADAAMMLARRTVEGAAALMAETGAGPAELRRQVTSPGGTTEAALEVLMGEAGLQPLLRAAVDAAVKRAKQLG